MNLSFSKIAQVPSEGLVEGRIYFEESTGLIKVATSATAVESYGGVQSAAWDNAKQTLTIVNGNGKSIVLDLSDVASATEVAAAIAGKADKTYVDTQLATKVDKVTGKQLSTNDYTTAEKTKLSGIAAGAQVNVLEGVQVNGADLTVTGKKVNVVIPAATVTGVAADDQVLSLAGGLLSTELSLEYDSTGKTIQLLGKDGDLIDSIDATDFIKDGMVDSVSFDPATKKLTITFNTESGKEAIDVDLTSLVDTYKAGTGITITSNTIAVNTSTIATVSSVDAKVKTVTDQIGTGFSASSTISQQLAAVKATADAAQTASEVSAAITAKIGTLDAADAAVAGQVVSSVTQTDGVIKVARRALVAADIPAIPTSKVSGLDTKLTKLESDVATALKPITWAEF